MKEEEKSQIIYIVNIPFKSKNLWIFVLLKLSVAYLFYF